MPPNPEARGNDEDRRAAIASILAAVAAKAPPAAALGLPPNPSRAAARAAFLSRAALVHPDKARGEPGAGPAFAALRRAWEAVQAEVAVAEAPRRPATAPVEEWWREWEGEEVKEEGGGKAEDVAWAAGLESAALAREVRSLQTALLTGPPGDRPVTACRLRAAREELARRAAPGSGDGGSGGGAGFLVE